MSDHRRVCVALLLAVLAASGAAGGSAAAAARSYRIEDFSATIRVEAAGGIEVTEAIRFRFDGSYRGVYRDIPLRYSDDIGFIAYLRLEVLSVSGEDGAPLRFEAGRAAGRRQRITIYIPDAQDAARTVRLRYRVERALRFFPEHDELYWNVTGTEWGVPIGAASARIVLPARLDERPRVTAYTGRFGSRGDAWRIASVNNEEVEVQTTAELGFGEGLTVVVGWPKGVVAEPAMTQKAGWLLADNWALLIPPLVFLIMFSVWRKVGKDPEVDRSVMPLYEAPENLTPAELGALVDERVDQRDIVATVVDLAVRGYLRIEESSQEGWLGARITTTLQRVRGADETLRPHEREVLEGLFESADRVTLDDLKCEFYEHIETIRKQVYGSLVEAGYFRASPQTVRRAWAIGGALLMALGLPLGVGAAGAAGAVAAVLSGLIVLAFAWFMPARTRSGRNKWIDVKGFEEFLGRTEGERLRSMKVDVQKFEAFLPFALALGVAENWGRAFDGLMAQRQAPAWYVGGGPFSPALFSSRMSNMSRSLGVAMATAPRSSSSGSSGFSSGGGFSGGGFGGGGGGAF